MEKNLNNFITYIIFFIILLMSSSCIEKNKISDNEDIMIYGEVKNLIIEHAVATRRECHTSKICINIEFTNYTNNNQTLLFTFYNDECEREVSLSNIKVSKHDELINDKYATMGINHKWLIMRDSLFFAVDKKDSLINLFPGESKIIEFRGMFPLVGSCLKRVFTAYKPFIYSDFKMVYELEDHKFKYRKSKDFEVVMFVDDTLVTINDSLLINKMIAPPIFSDSIPDFSIAETDLEADTTF